MAPIYTTATGITPQRLDDERLLKLLNDLKESSSLEHLVELLRPYQVWVFEELVCIHCIDCILSLSVDAPLCPHMFFISSLG